MHPYPSTVHPNQADKDLFTHENLTSGNKCRFNKSVVKSVNFTQEGNKFHSEPNKQSDHSKLVNARTVESERSCTHFYAKLDVNMQKFEDAHSLNQSNHLF